MIFATKKNLCPVKKSQNCRFFLLILTAAFGLHGDPADFDPTHLGQSHCLLG